MNKIIILFLFFIATILLTACGGGGGSSSNDNRQPSAGNSVLLSWVAPTTRVDDSFLPVSELDGYRIYYGTTAADLNVLVDLNDDSITEYTVDTLPAGNYYFAVTAYDTEGTESNLSNLINKDV
ncbi:MAG: fibronectin type III domain-containing protein [Candidatus Thiodiazotropha sp.]|jgi:hypothetical protein